MDVNKRLAMVEEIGSSLRSMVRSRMDSIRAGRTPPTHPVEFLEVVFKTRRGREVGRLPLEEAVYALGGDIYHYADFDLTDADKCEVAGI